MSVCEPYQVPVPWVSIAADWCFPEQGICTCLNVLSNLPLYLSWNPVCSSFVIHVQFISIRCSLSLFLRSISVAVIRGSLRRSTNLIPPACRTFLVALFSTCALPVSRIRGGFFFNVGPRWREQSTALRAVWSVPVRGRLVYGKWFGAWTKHF